MVGAHREALPEAPTAGLEEDLAAGPEAARQAADPEAAPSTPTSGPSDAVLEGAVGELRAKQPVSHRGAKRQKARSENCFRSTRRPAVPRAHRSIMDPATLPVKGHVIFGQMACARASELTCMRASAGRPFRVYGIDEHCSSRGRARPRLLTGRS